MRTLPIITSQHELQEMLRIWRHSMNRAIQVTPAPAVPWNFRATKIRGGIQLDWAQVKSPGCDGYIIQRADNADFSQNVVEIPVNSNLQTSYVEFYAAPTTKYYKILATSGTQRTPHSVRGRVSGIASTTSIDASDTVTTPTTTYDDTTSQDSSVGAGSGYGGGSGRIFDVY